jgi:hypothetical protein
VLRQILKPNVGKINHGWPDHVDAVVEHRDNEGNDQRCRDLATFVALRKMWQAKLDLKLI